MKNFGVDVTIVEFLDRMVPTEDADISKELAKHYKKLGVKLGETTTDGRVYLRCEEECVAACCGAPAAVINGHYHEKLTPQKVDELLDGLK